MVAEASGAQEEAPVLALDVVDSVHLERGKRDNNEMTYPTALSFFTCCSPQSLSSSGLSPMWKMPGWWWVEMTAPYPNQAPARE